MSSGVAPRRGAIRVRSSRLVKPRGSSRWMSRACSSAWTRGSPNRSPGMRVPAGVISGAVRAVKARAPRMGSWLMVWTPSRRRLAAKPICRRAWQAGQPLGDAEVGGSVVDGGLGPERPAELVVLLYFRMLVVDVQARDDPVGDDPGAEPARRGEAALADDPAGEDQRDLVRAADVEVVPDDLLEEDPPGGGCVQDLGEGELGLQDGQLVAVAGGDVISSERVRQDAQPLIQQGADIGRAEPVAEGLQRAGVLARGEPVVQGLEADPGPGGLPLGPLMAVDAQLGGIGEVRAELDEERAEVRIDAIEIEEVDQRAGFHQPRVGAPVGVVPALGPPHRCLLLRPPRVQHPLGAGEARQVPLRHLVLALLAEMHQVDSGRGDEVVDVRDERLGHRVHQRRAGVGVAAVAGEERGRSRAVLQPGLPHVQVHPVDRLDLEHDMPGKDISSRTR